MATTTNYGWTTPNDTDLVKDGAAAIRTLGSSIDTTLKTQIDAQIPDSLLTTKGDLIAASAASTPTRVGVGTNGQILTADSTESSGVKWVTPSSAGGMTLLSTSTLSGSTTTISTISQSYTNLKIEFRDVYASGGGNQIFLRFNGDTSSVYNSYVFRGQSGTLYQNANDNDSNLQIAQTSSSATARLKANGSIQINRYATADSVKHAFTESGGSGGAGDPHFYVGSTNYQSSSGISSVTFYLPSGTFSGGTIYIYGVN